MSRSVKSEAQLCMEDMLADLFGPGKVEVEHRFHPTRRWRFDYCVPAYQLAVELEGATWTAGRHTRGKGFAEDCRKYCAASILGWTVLRYTTEQALEGLPTQDIIAFVKSAANASKGHSGGKS